MNETIIALTTYIGWTMLLLLALALFRTGLVFGKKHSMVFKADGSDVSEFGFRLTRAQSNCVESFCFIGGLMLLALATDSQVITDGLAMWLIYARIGQSIVHMASISPLAIQVRFALFLVQFAICAYWVWMFFLKFSG